MQEIKRQESSAQRSSVPVVAITREEANRLGGKFVRLDNGSFTHAVFRQVPEGKEAEAIGLQYWFKYDLPFAKFKPYRISKSKGVRP